jgi:organic radical activating enzyme
MLDASPQSHQEFRQKLNAINSYKSDTCYNCNYQEDKKIKKTFRNLSFDVVPDDAEPGDASFLEIQIDKTCNGGCIICGPWNSSFWQSELKQFAIKPAQDPVDQILSFIDIQKTRRIVFLGGEPFLTDTDLRVLPLIQRPDLVDLQYTTNGSIYPSQKHIELWSRFRSVMIFLSLDGVGDKFDYIRYPLKWNQVEKNVFRMCEQMPPNVKFKSNHTINILNLFYYDEFDTWYKMLQHSSRILDFNFSPAAGILSPFKVPEKLYQMLISKYGEDSKVIRTVVDGDCNDHDEMLAYLDELDSRRGLDWRRVFPEISHCF